MKSSKVMTIVHALGNELHMALSIMKRGTNLLLWEIIHLTFVGVDEYIINCWFLYRFWSYRELQVKLGCFLGVRLWDGDMILT